MFFRGHCQNSAMVVTAEQAEASLIDLDITNGPSILKRLQETHPNRIFILLSINEPPSTEPNIVFVKKPPQAQTMMQAIIDARQLVIQQRIRATEAQQSIVETPPLKVISASARRATPRQAATLLDEQNLKSYLGHREDINPKDPQQLALVYYNPRDFLQSHVQSAWKVASKRNLAIRLETPWRAISFFPTQKLVHIKAEEAQIRAVCGIPYRHIAGVDIDLGEEKPLSRVVVITPDECERLLKSTHIMPMESFLWKIALLTSKGRLPDSLKHTEITALKYWPNMTRILMSPHAMSIASLLVNNPMDPFQAATELRIKQRYVFGFISAAHMLGLIEQRPRVIQVTQTPKIEEPRPVQRERMSLFKKLLKRLKMA
jgi:hypothetical protein